MSNQPKNQNQPKANDNKPEEKTEESKATTTEQTENKKEFFGKFKVLRGAHSEGGVTYGIGEEAGNILDSKSDLRKLGTDKFELITEY